MPNLNKEKIIDKIVEYIEKKQAEQGKYQSIENVEKFAEKLANHIIGY